MSMEFTDRPKILFVCSKCGHEQPSLALVREVAKDEMNGSGMSFPSDERPSRWRAYVCADPAACWRRQQLWKNRTKRWLRNQWRWICFFVKAVFSRDSWMW